MVKFLSSVDWDAEKEANEAIEMLQDWEFDVEQAIPMLSVLFSANDIYQIGIAKNRCVDIRRKAIAVLEEEDIDSLQRIMLQLAQAYRYEDFSLNLLKDFLLSKVTQNRSISHNFYWTITLEKNITCSERDRQNEIIHDRIVEQFGLLFDEFIIKLKQDDPEQEQILESQMQFRDQLFEMSGYVNGFNRINEKKERLREALREGGKYEMEDFEPKPMPLDPKVYVCGIYPEQCSVFTSAMAPLKLTFKVTEETKLLNLPGVDQYCYNVMYKKGDDVRQDQLVLQMIEFMDFILKQINLD